MGAWMVGSAKPGFRVGRVVLVLAALGRRFSLTFSCVCSLLLAFGGWDCDLLGFEGFYRGCLAAYLILCGMRQKDAAFDCGKL